MANAAGMVVPGNRIPGLAEAAIANNVFVKLGTIGTQKNYIKTAGAGEKTEGIVDEAYAAGETVSVIKSNTALLKLGSGGATAGNTLKADASGYGVVASGAGDYAGAIAMETGDENDLITVEVIPCVPQYHA